MLINLLKGREVAVKSEIEYIFRKHLNEIRPTKRAKEGPTTTMKQRETTK